MRSALKFILVLAAATVLMLAFRALAFTVYTVRGTALEPCLINGDRVLVNRWSYGLRAGGSKAFRYVRWMAQPVERGDLIAFNCPADSSHRISSHPTFICYCKAVPGDTVRIADTQLIVPGRKQTIAVTPQNARLIAYLYNRFEGRKATVKGGVLMSDGVQTRFANFNNDYYWLYSGQPNDANDSRCFGLVPETHVIGRVSMLLYSIAPDAPLHRCFRSGRNLLFIKKTAD